MHLVFATSLVPAGQPRSGYEIATMTVLDALRRAGVRVTVLGFTLPETPRPERCDTIVLGTLDVRNDSAGPLKKMEWTAAALSRGMTVSSAKLRILKGGELRRTLAGLEPFDGYVLNSVQLAAAYPEIFSDKPAIYVAHNVEHRSAEENAEAADNLAERLMYRREARLLKGIEQDLCRRARFVFTFAEEDRRLLGIATGDRSAALPLVTGNAPRPRGKRDIAYDATLIGTWTWAPNRIGLDWFLNEVLPRLREDFIVAIAGRVPAGLAERHRRVTFVGQVEDAAAFMKSGRVAPLISRAGTGVQLKTIETFELGLASVATTRSVRGIANVPANCTVTDDTESFAKALEAAAAGKMKDIDGRAFHAAQKRMLDEEVRRGLLGFGIAGEREEAA